MQIRSKLALHLATLLALVSLLVVALYTLVQACQLREQRQLEGLRLQALAAELPFSADALGRMARLYVYSGDVRYLRYYEELLDILDGRRERPAGYGPGYWNLREAGAPVATPVVGEAHSLLARLRAAGASEQELAEYEALLRRLMDLVGMERQAMNLAGEAWTAGLGRRPAVFGEAYLRERAALVAPLQRLQQQLQERLVQAQRESHLQVRRSAWVAGGVALLLVLHALWATWRFDSSVRRPLAVLRQWGAAVRAGRLDSRTRLDSADEFGELSAVIDEMTASVERSLAELREEVQRRKRAEEAVQHQANHDALTGLPSLRLLHDRLDRALARAERQQEQLALIFIDLNGFKPVNDRYGHEAGDVVLKVVAQRLAGALRDSDTVGRVGGDEFVAVLVDVAGREAAELVRAKLEALVAQPVYLPGAQLAVQVSAAMGLALYPETARDAAGLLRQADLEMYARKAQYKRANGEPLGREPGPPAAP